jgi:acetoin utilization deacetylase AcuC-like enzyme/GNAT superfamily N-acetyltransferase
MFRIRRIHDDLIPVNRDAIARVQEILRAQFAHAPETDVTSLPEKLRDPFKYKFRTVLFIAEDLRGKVRGFASMLHAPDVGFCYLDYIATDQQRVGRGIGGALYQRVREEARSLESLGVFLEALSDDPKLCKDPETLKQNQARLRFYETFGAYPIVGTQYEVPVGATESCPPHLVYDSVGKDRPLRQSDGRAVVRAILERKYKHLCPPKYVQMVVDSFKDDPVKLRAPRYVKKPVSAAADGAPPKDKRIALLVTDQHAIHHVRERGYVESPVRVRSLMKELDRTQLFETMKVQHFGEKYIRAVHDGSFVSYLKAICEKLEPDRSIYPYVFPIRNASRKPDDLPTRAGYYCIDTFTPLNRNAYTAAKRCVDCALSGAKLLLEGHHLAYALVRPPGHHAERRAFGGFCYFNNASIAAHYLSETGKVAILDIDYHHGNGHQDIFYERADVLTISIHGHPRFAYPYFTGFEDEDGSGEGKGLNVNYPLPEAVDGVAYTETLLRALRRIVKFQPQFLIVPLGLDTAKGDPTGSWSLRGKDFERNGSLIGELQLPTLVVQEGGYDNRVLGSNARHFFEGLWSGTYETKPPAPSSAERRARDEAGRQAAPANAARPAGAER